LKWPSLLCEASGLKQEENMKLRIKHLVELKNGKYVLYMDRDKAVELGLPMEEYDCLVTELNELNELMERRKKHENKKEV